MGRVFLASILALFVSSQGCETETHACSDVGCIDSVSFQIKTADGTWPDGAYTVELTANGASYACSMTLPDDLPANGSISTIRCEPPLSYVGVTLRTDVLCTEHHDATSGSQSCTPVPGHYTLSGSLASTPSTLSLRVTRDSGLLVEQSLPLTYSTTQPNGPDCGPTCRQASVELTLP
jgi:hypothetical protein